MHLTINLATQCYYNRSLFKRTLGAGCVLLLLTSILGMQHLQKGHTELMHAQKEIELLNKKLSSRPAGVSEAEYTNHCTQVAALNQIFMQHRVSQLHLLDTLELATPSGIAYTLITPETKSKQVKLEGRALSLDKLSELLERLEATKGIHNPTLLSTEDVSKKESLQHSIGIRFALTFVWIDA